MDDPKNNGPARIAPPKYARTPKMAAAIQTKPLNHMQRALVRLAANLPDTPGQDVQEHAARVKVRPQEPPAKALATVHDASAYVKQRLGSFFSAHA